MSKKNNEFKTPWKKSAYQEKKSIKRKSGNRKSQCRIGCETTSSDDNLRKSYFAETKDNEIGVENVNPNSSVFI